MNRWAIAFIGLTFSISISSKTESLTGSSGLIFEGTIIAENDQPVPGAEIQIVDGFGKTTNHVLSDLKGFYRFPLLLASNEETRSLGLEISHLRFQPVRLKDVLSGAIIGPPARTNLAPGGLAPLLASTQTVRRDFVLTANRPPLGPIDPGRAESVYQEGLLNLNRNPKQALEQLKTYAQTGQNMKQVGRALTLITEYSK